MGSPASAGGACRSRPASSRRPEEAGGAFPVVVSPSAPGEGHEKKGRFGFSRMGCGPALCASELPAASAVAPGTKKGLGAQGGWPGPGGVRPNSAGQERHQRPPTATSSSAKRVKNHFPVPGDGDAVLSGWHSTWHSKAIMKGRCSPCGRLMASAHALGGETVPTRSAFWLLEVYVP